MTPGRTQRNGLQPTEIEKVVGTLRDARQNAVEVLRNYRPFGPEYKAANAVADAIDNLIRELTGEPESVVG